MTALPAPVRLLVDADAVVVDARDRCPARDLGAEDVASSVVLVDGRPGARGRLRRRAARLGLRIEREYVLLPTARRATFVAEDHATTLSWVWRNLATVPPGVSRPGLAVDALVRLVAGLRLVPRLGSVVPGRVVVARRP